MILPHKMDAHLAQSFLLPQSVGDTAALGKAACSCVSSGRTGGILKRESPFGTLDVLSCTLMEMEAELRGRGRVVLV